MLPAGPASVAYNNMPPPSGGANAGGLKGVSTGKPKIVNPGKKQELPEPEPQNPDIIKLFEWLGELKATEYIVQLTNNTAQDAAFTLTYYTNEVIEGQGKTPTTIQQIGPFCQTSDVLGVGGVVEFDLGVCLWMHSYGVSMETSDGATQGLLDVIPLSQIKDKQHADGKDLDPTVLSACSDAWEVTSMEG